MGTRAEELLRDGLLDGVAVAVAGASGAVGVEEVSAAVRRLGGRAEARAIAPAADAESGEAAAHERVTAALERLGSLGAVVIDGAGLFTAAGSGKAALMDCLETCWNAARATANAAFLPAGEGGRIVLLAAAAGGEHADAAAAGLENLARTLSIEWARYGITTVAVAPSATTSGQELAALVCYLLSPAGEYFSGCLMDLRGPGS